MSNQSNVWFTSDWHLNHRGITDKFRTNFKDSADHDNTIIENYKKVINKRSLVYFLGDICFDEASVEVIKSLPGRKVLVLGNHDITNVVKLSEAFERIISLGNYKGNWISHCPIHPQEMRNRSINIHGHLHYSELPDMRYFDVCLEKWDYHPVNGAVITDYAATIKKSLDKKTTIRKLNEHRNDRGIIQ